MCQSKTRVSYKCSLYKITARNKPLSTKKLIKKVTQHMFLLFPWPWSAPWAVQTPTLFSLLLALGASKGLHDHMQVKVSREPPLGVYRWGAELRALLGLRPPGIVPQGEGKAGAPWSSGVGMLVKAGPQYT